MSAPAEPFILYRNLLRNGVTYSGGTAAGYDPAAVAEENTYQVWRGSGVSSNLGFDFGAPVTFDTVAVAAHNLADVGARLAWAWKAEAADAYTYVAASGAGAMTDNGPIAMLSAAPVTARYVLLNVTTITPAAPVVLGVVSIGQRLKLPAFPGADFVRPDDCRTIDGDASLSIEGQYLGATIRRKAGRLKQSLSPVPRTWADANLPAFRDHYDARRPFFYAPGPAAFPGDLVYGWRGDGVAELRQTVMTGGRLVSFNMELDFYAA